MILNGVISFLQEDRAERSLAALKKMSSPHARVLRGGHVHDVNANEVVPGDLLLLEAGDHISADGRIIEAFGLSVQESALTGESTPVEKDHTADLPENVPLGDQRNMVFLGTIVVAGKATVLVTATAMQTQLGQIAGMLSDQGANKRRYSVAWLGWAKHLRLSASCWWRSCLHWKCGALATFLRSS